MAHAALNTMLRNQVSAARHARTARYMARVDDQMLGMDRDAQLTFLRGELAKWNARYAAFTTEVFSGRPLTTDATAWDFAETIATVAARIARLEREQVAA